MTAPELAVRESTARDRRAVAAVLGRAFQVDPVYRWLYPDPTARERRLGSLMDVYLRHLHAGMGTVEVATDPAGAIVGAAVWDRPGALSSARWHIVRALPGMLWATGRDLPRLARLGEVLEAARPSPPHWYLFHLGAEPDHQRSGIGTALLDSMLARCPTGAYLECCDANLDYYRRFGFAPADTVEVDETLSVRTMWRDPPPAPGRPAR